MKSTLLLLILLAASFAFADDLAASANQAFQAQQWKSAADLYAQLTQSEPNNPLYWYRLGTASRHTGDYAKAESALTESKKLGFQPMIVNIGLAAVETQTGRRDQALDVIEALAKNGAPAATFLESDADFKPLASDARFTNAIAEMKDQAAPCKNHEKRPQYREFDFWVGNWDVYGRGGVLAGHSHVDLILGDCVLSENWTSFTGNEGKSYNKYNALEKRWEQYWVDESGSTTYYTGHLENGNMVFKSDNFDPTGKVAKLRLTFFNLGPDKVRQFGEMSKDNGATWQTQYDLTYVRRKGSTTAAGN